MNPEDMPGLIGKMVSRPSANPDGSTAIEGQDLGTVQHIGFPGPGAPLQLLVSREVTGALEWWGLEPVRPVNLVSPDQKPDPLDEWSSDID